MNEKFDVFFPKSFDESIGFLTEYGLESYAKPTIQVISVFKNKIRKQELVTIKYFKNGKSNLGSFYTENIFTEGGCDGF